VKKSASEYQEIKKEVKNYELKVDPAGAVPTIKHAEKAAQNRKQILSFLWMIKSHS
jgi:hypothetical protein